MRKRKRTPTPSPAMVVACIALTVALSGVGYAAITIPRNSVGTSQLKRNAVVSSKVKDRSLKANDFALGQLPAGPQGPQGPQGTAGTNGTAGAPGTARAYAAVVPSGASVVLDSTRTANFTAVSRFSTGVYCLSAGVSSASFPAVVSVDWTNTTGPEGEAVAMAQNDALGCTAGQFKVRTYRHPIVTGDSQAAVLTDDVAFNIVVP